MYITTLTRWGDDYVVSLPGELIAQVGLHVGDELDARVEQGCLFLAPIRNQSSQSTNA